MAGAGDVIGDKGQREVREGIGLPVSREAPLMIEGSALVGVT